MLKHQLKRYENSCNDLAKILINFLEKTTSNKSEESSNKLELDIIDSVLKVDL